MSAVGPDIAGYQFREHLGEGGFADVYRYLRHDVGTNVAIKILKAGLRETQQLRDEAQTMGRLGAFGHHPHIVAVQQIGEVDGRPFLVMEFCPNGSLKARMKQGPVSVREALRIGVQVASALAAAHRAGTAHLDVKPDNILISTPGQYKLSDFGISLRSSDGRRTLLGHSPRYAAPEIILSQSADPPADIYGLANTLYTLLAGHPPFVLADGDNSDAAVEQRTTERVPQIPPIGRSDVPSSLARQLVAAMAREPFERERRVASAKVFAERLQAIELELALPVTEFVEPSGEVPSASEHTRPPRPRGDSFIPVARTPSRTPDAGPLGTHVKARPVAAEQPLQETDGDADEGRLPDLHIKRERTPKRRGRTVVATIGAVAVVAIAAAAIVGYTVLDPPAAPSTTAAITAPPQDPLITRVPTPVVTAAWTTDDEVTFSWTYEPALAGDYFRVRLVGDPAGGTTTVREPKWTIKAVDDRPCVEVTLYRSNGRGADEPGRACAP